MITRSTVRGALAASAAAALLGTIPIIQTNRGTWFSKGKNIIVFADAGDDGTDARCRGMAISGKSGQNMKISLKSAGRGPNEATLELHMIFKKQ